ncbi:MAG TPA: hypothetical protein VFU71_21285 [Burkholderiaceae bacterium]|nr:hypothetical protein [Burkholderiaceae bacterium]
MASMFERVVSLLFESAEAPADTDRQLITETIDDFVETVEPRVRLTSHYRDKLAGNVAHTLAHLRKLATLLPREPLVLSRSAWSQDPHVRSYFAAADDVSRCIGRCDELRDFFASHAASADACALLGMQRKEKTVLAPRMEGEVLRQDVPQTTVGFSNHRLLAVAPDLAQSRLEVGRRIMERLAQLVLGRVVQTGEEARDREQRKAMLSTRLRMLRSARDGMAPLVSEGPDIDPQISELERQLNEMKETAASAAGSHGRMTLDGTIDQMNAVLAQPEQHIALAKIRLRVNRLGVKVDPHCADEGDSLELDELSIGEGLRATIKFVRIARDEMPPKEDLLAQAQRAL